MNTQTAHIISQAIRYIEEHLNQKLDLDMVAGALHYSKYHLHRMFKRTVGLTLHDYVRRRQITEAAKLLVASDKTIIEIAVISGYESQQAFHDIFKAMYKVTPGEFREAEEFYPLQHEIRLNVTTGKRNFTKDDIRFAKPSDMVDWMELVRLAVDGFPRLNEAEYTENLKRRIADKEAMILRDRGAAVGIMVFSAEAGAIEFLAVHPQYRNLGITKIFLERLADGLICGREVSITTYREGDKADTGYRKEYRSLGFAERELLVEYGYPTQRFVFCMKSGEEARYE
jgi:AraC-like DNA-binding protein/GNAT superfamily N-acetyltransferase